jgi:menaquinone-dependent protoporphyrinogen oxidase
MDTEPVLVTYASTQGSTAEIADAIRDGLLEHEVDTAALPVGEVRDLASYRAVVLGSAVYAGHWDAEAARFLRRNRRVLAERDVWLFQSGPLNDSADRETVPLPRKVAALAEQIGARGHTTFGGKLDSDARGFVARKMVVNGLAGDFRNFERVRAFACEIAGALSSHTA